jgi:hypothetical protein
LKSWPMVAGTKEGVVQKVRNFVGSSGRWLRSFSRL